MGDYLTKGTTYADGGVVNAANLNAHVDDAVFKSTAISARTDLPAPGGAVEYLVNDAGTLKKVSQTNLAAAVVGSTLIHGKTEITTLTDADEFLVWEDGVAADRKITRANMVLNGQLMPVGAILQTLVTEYTTNENIPNTIPVDDTAPLVTEGFQILSQAITPKSTSNKVLVRFQGYAAVNNANNIAVAAVFRGSTCIAAEAIQAFNGIAPTCKFAMDVLDSPASVAAQTYTVRVGSDTGSIRMNGYTTSRLFGGSSRATLAVQEIKQ